MIWHKFKLFMLRAQTTVFLAIMTIFSVAAFILLVTILSKMYDQSRRNEQTLKSLSCILLILPENRNKDNIAKCVELNTGRSTLNSGFLFEALPQSTQQQLTEEPNFMALLKGEKGDMGARGRDGNSITGPQGPVGQTGESVQGPPGETGPQGEPGAAGREVEFRYNNKKARIEWRYVGDTFWTVLINACELIKNCEIPTDIPQSE